MSVINWIRSHWMQTAIAGLLGGAVLFPVAQIAATGVVVYPYAGNVSTRVINITRNPHVSYSANTNASAIMARPNDKIEYQVAITNTGANDLSNVTLLDSLPGGVALSNSVRSISHNLGTIKPKATVVSTIIVTVTAKTNGLYISNSGCFKADHNQSACDHAVIRISNPPVVTSPSPKPPVKPTPSVSSKPTPSISPKPKATATPKPTPSTTPIAVVACTNITATPVGALDSQIWNFGLTAGSTGRVTGYSFNFGDGQSVNTDATHNTIAHAFAPGTYKVVGQIKSAAGISAATDDCSVTVTTGPTTLAASTNTPNTITKLADTGAESMLGGAAGLSALSYASVSYLRSRKSLLSSLHR